MPILRVPRERRNKKKTGNEASPSNTDAEAAPIVANPPQKTHDKNKNKGRERSRATTPKPKDSEKPCYFHFKKKDCTKGKDCRFSHLDSVHGWKKKEKERREASRSRKQIQEKWIEWEG